MKDAKHLILHVDDDPDMLDAMRLRLQNAGFAVATASSAEDGLKAYKAQTPDFILIDLMMEEVDAGIHLVKELKLLGNQAPVYMLSSVGDQLNQVANYAELGLMGVFQKPVNFDSLLRTIRSKLG
jgi:two-component system, OmpR family, alkaline phosphatase synthesis response regulator PhoP